MGGQKYDSAGDLRRKKLVEAINSTKDAKIAESWVNDVMSVQAVIEELDVEPPKQRPLVRNRNPTFDVTFGECREIKAMYSDGMSISEIADAQMLTDEEVKSHLGTCKEHNQYVL